MTKKSVEIIGLPIISITEGRELGMSKTLLIDAKNGAVAAITIEDEDWYRGVKLLPYSSVIAIGEDAVTITNSENILTLENASDYENMLDANIKIIGTKAITKSGTIQGKVSEIYIGEAGRIEKCVIVNDNNEESELSADQVSIFGKQVTVIDPSESEKKNPTPEIKEVPKPAPLPKPQKEEVKPTPEAPKPVTEQPSTSAADKATEERHRRFLLGKKASRKIMTDNGVVIVEEGADITEEVLQKAKLANKFIELSMNIQ